MDDNLINNFIDIFSNYYILFYSFKNNYYSNCRNNKLYPIISKYKNDNFESIYTIFFNNQRYYDDNIEKLKSNLKIHIYQQYNNIDYVKFKLLYSEIKEMYDEEIINFT